MRKERCIASFGVLLTVALLLSLIPLAYIETASASPGKMVWSIVDTPRADSNTNVIANPVTGSEINVIAIGSDDRTFYAVDIPNSKVHKSNDGGVTWAVELVSHLTAAGANLPVWNLAVAPDDVNFLVAITDETGVPDGPKEVFVSEDGGANWKNTNISLSTPAEYISCLDVSVTYGNNRRDIAIGTRDGSGNGKVYVRSIGFGANWNPQDGAAAGWVAGDVVALKFSPAYPSDFTLVAISSNVDTRLRLGSRDVAANSTSWDIISGYPVVIRDTSYSSDASPDKTQIITADLDLPSDFSGSDSSLRRFYVATDAVAPGVQSGIYCIDNTVPHRIGPPTTGRVSSIDYRGTNDEGGLLAGEVTAAELTPNPSSWGVYVWRTSNPNTTVGTPTWKNSEEPNSRKSPTGGFGSGFANAQVSWSHDGTRAYCGTSSATPAAGGTGTIADLTRWPGAWLNDEQLDESAFSVSPYSVTYEQLLNLYGKPKDTDVGNVWNQLSLIDTNISFLSDVAALEAPESAEGSFEDYGVLYLASCDDTGGYDSIWRSTSNPLGRTWERVLCMGTTSDDVILRVKQTPYDEAVRSEGIAFADLGTDIVGYSGDEGQVWGIRSFTTVTDLAVAKDDVIYILDDTVVYRYVRSDSVWSQSGEENTNLESGHTIAVPLKNPSKEGEGTADWVIVGEAGPPNGRGRAVYADFSAHIVDFEPPVSELAEVPIPGNAHVIADDKFEQNKIIYNAINDSAGNSGKIYRSVIDGSAAWDEMEPPNSAFYGLAQRNDVLYGAWASAEVPAIVYGAGADRTLYSRASVPPPPEWDYLVEGISAGVVFTREPSSLKISSNGEISLWAIDNRPYDWVNKFGCLWAYADTVAKVGPWTTAPASGDFIPVDPVTGRASEVNFRWRQISYASVYELQLAKDSDFNTVVLRNEGIVPVDQLSPECYFPAGGLVPTPASDIASFGNLEAGHVYYWRVRARAAVTGEVARSPWSATMYFTVMAGFPVMAEHPAVTLLSPPYGAGGVSCSPGFSWSPMPGTSKYEFVLAKDSALQNVVVKTNVPLTSYLYDGKLDPGASYFWQVRAIEPIVSSPSAIGSFTVIAEEKPVEPTTEESAPIPFWVWGVVAVYTILAAAMIAFAMVKPRYVRLKGALDIELKSVTDKPQSLIAKIWSGIIVRAKRLRFWRRPGDGSYLDKLK